MAPFQTIKDIGFCFITEIFVTKLVMVSFLSPYVIFVRKNINAKVRQFQFGKN